MMNNTTGTKKNLVLKKSFLRRIKIFISLVILLGTSFLISSSTKKVVTLYYKEDSNVNYLVYLKENDYYTSKYLTKGMKYIASLIDYIDINFNYNFKMNEQIKYSYSYYIEADVKVFEKGNTSNVIFEKRNKLWCYNGK